MVLVLLAAVSVAGLVRDKVNLRQELVRLHVVAESDNPEDQTRKLQVRDTVLAYLSEMPELADGAQARTWLKAHLKDIQDAANAALQNAGSEETAVVTLEAEAFPKRTYETFALPSGVYEALRVTIGSGKGKNWWCVVFPSLCLPETAESFEAMAVENGMDGDLACTLAGKEGYEVRFYLLDLLGKRENFIFGG